MADLVALPGVGRKTANVVLGVIWNAPEGVVVDTHVMRLSQRLGWTKNTDAAKIEKDLCAILPRNEWDHASHVLIFHGRRCCYARKPECEACSVSDVCPSAFRRGRRGAQGAAGSGVGAPSGQARPPFPAIARIRVRWRRDAGLLDPAHHRGRRRPGQRARAARRRPASQRHSPRAQARHDARTPARRRDAGRRSAHRPRRGAQRGVAGEGAGEDGHRRAPAPAGRADRHRSGRRQARAAARLHLPRVAGREGRPSYPLQPEHHSLRRSRAGGPRPGHHARRPRTPAGLRRHQRTHRSRQDVDAVRAHAAHRSTPGQRRHPGGPHRGRASTGSRRVK